MIWEPFVRILGRIVTEYPALWPLLIFPCLLPVVALLSRWPRANAFATRYRSRAFVWGGLVCLGLFGAVAVIYLCNSAFWDPYESRESSLAALLARGGVVYPDLSSQERYAAPYGPVFYAVLAVSQRFLGPSVFSTKLPGVIAALLSVSVFWEILRRLCGSARAAWALAGLEAALLLALRQQIFWAKADPLLLLLVTLGFGCALGRAKYWPWCFGLCLGLAVNLKLHAPVYFLPALVAAHKTGWRTRESLCAGTTAVIAVLLPFILCPRQFPVVNYLEFLRATAHEGFGFEPIFGFWRWVFLLGATIFLSDRLVTSVRPAAPGERALRWRFRAALLIAVLLAAIPGCSVGAGQAHLIPLIPACLLAAGDRFVRGGTARWDRSPNVFWRTALYASLAACGMVAVQTTGRMATFHRNTETAARDCRDDLRRIIARFPDRTILAGSGTDQDAFATGFRHEAVFAGHPIGLDVAALMDYQQAGLPEPDLSRFTQHIRSESRRPLLWLLPRGGAPFSQTNLYDHTRPVLSDRFRRDFSTLYERREQTRFYDLYFPKSDAL